MQIVGRQCESCGATVQRVGDGDGCGSCDVVVCAKCLQGTARCPSCQRAFDETRDVAARAKDEGVERGRKQAVAIAVSVLVALVILALLTGQLLAVPLQVFVFGMLFMQLFRGRAWARWALVVLTGIVAVSHAGAAFGIVASGQPVLLSGAVAISFAWSALILALSPPLARYLRAQRAKSP